MKHVRGQDEALMQARRDVDAVLEKLMRDSKDGRK